MVRFLALIGRQHTPPAQETPGSRRTSVDMSQSQALPAPAPRTRRRQLADDTAVVVGVVLAVAALLAVAWVTRAIIVWILAAAFLAFSIDPLAQSLSRRAKVGHGAGITLALLVLALILFVIGLIVIPPVVDGAKGLADAIPEYAERLEDSSFVESLGAEDQVESAESATEDISNFFSGISSIVGTIGALASGAFAGFMIFVLTIYFMIYGRDIRRGIGARLGPERGPRFMRTTKRIFDATRAYWYGKFLIAAIAGVSVYIPMVLLDIPFAAPLAFFVAITDLIPNVGATLGAIPVVGVALFEDWWKGLIMGIVILVYQQAENSIITPKVFQKAIDLHPMLSFVAVLFFGAVFGVIGTLLALPVTAAIRIALQEWRQDRTPLPAPP
jgi:predicted PurR-regulated permease PerM